MAEQVWWAIKAAPVANAQEWAVLVAMAEAADQDGCNSFLSILTIAARTRLAESTVRRRMSDLEERGLIRQGDQRAARIIPANRRPVVYDLQVPLSYFRPEKRYDGGEAELSVNVWRAGRGRKPLTSQERPDLGPAPERKVRTRKTPDSGVSETEVSEGHPKGFQGDTPGGVPGTPNPPHNPPHDPQSSAALRAATAEPVETSSSNVTPGNARGREGAAAAESSADDVPGDASRAVTAPAGILEAMMLNPDESARFRAWLVTATNATNPDGLIVALHASGRLSERLTQWRTSEDTPGTVNGPTAPRVVHLEWCGRCDRTTRTASVTDQDGREYVRRCPTCNIHAGRPAAGSGASQEIAQQVALAAANSTGGGRDAAAAARAALPQGVGRRITTLGTPVDVATLRTALGASS